MLYCIHICKAVSLQPTMYIYDRYATQVQTRPYLQFQSRAFTMEQQEQLPSRDKADLPSKAVPKQSSDIAPPLLDQPCKIHLQSNWKVCFHCRIGSLKERYVESHHTLFQKPLVD
mmetsp:Transcript_26167/g.43468  ORF Transcript_26167/g.43468 Transcript_26167/m.43468 type:complete len:115 (+) Transcript_26167:13-357(+)